ncbi:hypothetical protein CRU96_05760 [Malaciobacter halophilus]|nr:site-specific integrase [Malaciobacter halophilus]RYA23913.1 hypothetical protein CRU96_05760 [Malaciobacter halophilus]
MIGSKRYGSKVQLNYLKGGDISYFIVYKSGKKTIYKKVGRKSEGINEKKAIELRNQILSELRHGIDLSQKSMKTLTLDRLAELYFASIAAHCKSHDKYKQEYERHIKPAFGDLPIAMLDDILIQEFQAIKLSDKKSKGSINQYIKGLKRILNYAIRKSIISHSPFKEIRMFQVDNSRLRYLSLKEVQLLQEEVQDHLLLKLVVKISLSTGARINSVLGIQKKHIDQENKTVQLYDYKRKCWYVGYLDQETFHLVCDHIQEFGINDHVVSLDGKKTKYADVYKLLRLIFDERFNQGLEKKDRANRVVIHTLRHTFASHLAISGVSIQKIQKLMNHKDIKQTMKYAKLSPDSGRNAVEELYKG